MGFVILFVSYITSLLEMKNIMLIILCRLSVCVHAHVSGNSICFFIGTYSERHTAFLHPLQRLLLSLYMYIRKPHIRTHALIARFSPAEWVCMRACVRNRHEERDDEERATEEGGGERDEIVKFFYCVLDFCCSLYLTLSLHLPLRSVSVAVFCLSIIFICFLFNGCMRLVLFDWMDNFRFQLIQIIIKMLWINQPYTYINCMYMLLIRIETINFIVVFFICWFGCASQQYIVRSRFRTTTTTTTFCRNWDLCEIEEIGVCERECVSFAVSCLMWDDWFRLRPIPIPFIGHMRCFSIRIRSLTVALIFGEYWICSLLAYSTISHTRTFSTHTHTHSMWSGSISIRFWWPKYLIAICWLL